jgi:hypothetical protein
MEGTPQAVSAQYSAGAAAPGPTETAVEGPTGSVEMMAKAFSDALVSAFKEAGIGTQVERHEEPAVEPTVETPVVEPVIEPPAEPAPVVAKSANAPVGDIPRGPTSESVSPIKTALEEGNLVKALEAAGDPIRLQDTVDQLAREAMGKAGISMSRFMILTPAPAA